MGLPLIPRSLSRLVQHTCSLGLLLGLLGASPAWAQTTPAAKPEESPATVDPATVYTQAMVIGYAATAQRDYHTALINFRRALAARPGDRYALAAIANMETYIARERAAVARAQRILTLQATVSQAVQVSDWACAVASLDELITLLPPDPLEQARLVAYRGEISGLMAAGDRLEQWSTVCPG